MGKIAAVCISEKKGTVKKDIGRCLVIKGFGLAGDAHAGQSLVVKAIADGKACAREVDTYLMGYSGL